MIYRSAVSISKKASSRVLYTDSELRNALIYGTVDNTSNAFRLFGVPLKTINTKLNLITQSFNGAHGITNVTSLKRFARASESNANIVKKVILNFKFPTSGAQPYVTDIELALLASTESEVSDLGINNVELSKVSC